MSSIRDEMTGRYSINGYWNAAQGLRALCHLCHPRQATGCTHQCTWKMHEAGTRTNTCTHCIRPKNVKASFFLHCFWINLLLLWASGNACLVIVILAFERNMKMKWYESLRHSHFIKQIALYSVNACWLIWSSSKNVFVILQMFLL